MIQKSGKVITGFRIDEPRVASVSGTSAASVTPSELMATAQTFADDLRRKLTAPALRRVRFKHSATHFVYRRLQGGRSRYNTASCTGPAVVPKDAWAIFFLIIGQ